jgi:hypothetical protein
MAHLLYPRKGPYVSRHTTIAVQEKNNMVNIIKDMKTGETSIVRICYQCDPDTYPRGKPIINYMNAKKDEKGNWVCSECQTEDLNKMFLRTLGPQHPKCQAFIKAEDNQVGKYNDAALRLNEVSGQHLMSYKRNRYTNSMPLSR